MRKYLQYAVIAIVPFLLWCISIVECAPDKIVAEDLSLGGADGRPELYLPSREDAVLA